MFKKKFPRSKFENGLLTRPVCPRRLSFSQFGVLMSTFNCEKDSHLGQTVLVKRPFSNFDRGNFFFNTLYIMTPWAASIWVAWVTWDIVYIWAINAQIHNIWFHFILSKAILCTSPPKYHSMPQNQNGNSCPSGGQIKWYVDSDVTISADRSRCCWKNWGDTILSVHRNLLNIQ